MRCSFRLRSGLRVLIAAVVAVGSLDLGCSSAGSSGSGGSSGSSGSSGDTGSSGSSGASGTSGTAGAASALPASTFLYVSKVARDRDVLIAYDTATGQTHTVTDLRGDGSEGWSIDGYGLSPDRTRIAIASLYGPTKEDVDTKLSAQRIWTFAADGTDFRRLTPVFPNQAAGRSQFQISVRNPVFSQSGKDVIYGYGEYWYEGTKLQGGSGIWSVEDASGRLPAFLQSSAPCSFVNPSVDPKTGKLAVIHSICVGGSQDGIYLYAPDGSGTPEKLVGSDAALDVTLETPRWTSDGSGFVFIGTTTVMISGASTVVRGLFVFDMTTRKASPVVLPQTLDTLVVDATIAPDARAVVYCLRKGEADDLHAIDLTTDPPTDAPITSDGKSCHPVW